MSVRRHVGHLRLQRDWRGRGGVRSLRRRAVEVDWLSRRRRPSERRQLHDSPDAFEGNEFASSYSLSVSNIALVDAQNLCDGRQHVQHRRERLHPSVTNSFTSTVGIAARTIALPQRTMRCCPMPFNPHSSRLGDFRHAVRQCEDSKFPLKTPSLTQAANAVVAKFTDGTSSTMSLAMMPGGGTFSVVRW